jgi:hypothetical protein
MSRQRWYVVRLVAFVIMFVPCYVLVALGLMGAAFVANYRGTIVNATPIIDNQRWLYEFGQMRNVWQFQRDCVSLVDILIYQPAIGTCEFNNVEFTTRLNFDDLGRFVPKRQSHVDPRDGIVVLGDSHAMGWGVNDDETFSNVLQEQTARPVFNLAVASYATKREFQRLVKTGLLDKVTTIVIQYCDNDLGENNKGLILADEAAGFKEMFQRMIDPTDRMFADYLSGAMTRDTLKEMLKAPIRSFYQRTIGASPQDPGEDFEPHFHALSMVLTEHSSLLRDKQILIVYINAHGKRFANFGAFRIVGMPHISFIELNMSREHFYLIDDHPNVDGHAFIGNTLAKLIRRDLRN